VKSTGAKPEGGGVRGFNFSAWNFLHMPVTDLPIAKRETDRRRRNEN